MFILITILALLALSQSPPANARPLSEVDPEELVITTVNNVSVCRVHGKQYNDGEKIETGDPCESCRCRPPGFACNLIRCSPVKPPPAAEDKGCQWHKPPNTCCPVYICLPKESSEDEKGTASNTPKPPPESNEINGTPFPEAKLRSEEAFTESSEEEGKESSEESGTTTTLQTPDARKEDPQPSYVILDGTALPPASEVASNVSARSEDDEDVASNYTDSANKARADEVLILLDDQQLNSSKEFRHDDVAANETVPEERFARASDVIVTTPEPSQPEEGTVNPALITLPALIPAKEPKSDDIREEPAVTKNPSEGGSVITLPAFVPEKEPKSEEAAATQAPTPDPSIVTLPAFVPGKEPKHDDVKEDAATEAPTEQGTVNPSVITLPAFIPGKEPKHDDKVEAATTAPVEQGTVNPSVITLPATVPVKEFKNEAGDEVEAANSTYNDEKVASRKKRHAEDEVQDVEQSPDKDINIKEFVVIIPEKESVDNVQDETPAVVDTKEVLQEKEVVPEEEQAKDVLAVVEQEKGVPVEEETKELLGVQEPEKEIVPKEDEAKEVLNVSEQEKVPILNAEEAKGDEIKEVLNVPEQEKVAIPVEEGAKEILNVPEYKEDIAKDELKIPEQEKEVVPVEGTKEILHVLHAQDKEPEHIEEKKDILISEQEKEDPKEIVEQKKDVLVSEDSKEVIPEQTEEKKDVFTVSEAEPKPVVIEEAKQERKDVIEPETTESVGEVNPEQVHQENSDELDPVVTVEEHDSLQVKEPEVAPAIDEVNVGLPESEVQAEEKSANEEEHSSVLTLDRKKRHDGHDHHHDHDEKTTVSPAPTSILVEGKEKTVLADNVGETKGRHDELPVPPPQEVITVTPKIIIPEVTEAAQPVEEKDSQTEASPKE